MILVTGSSGLIGRHLVSRLRDAGTAVNEFDILRSPSQDTRNPTSLAAALAGATGIVHLAAVSRVLWGERVPKLTWDVNVGALEALVGAMRCSASSPWLLFASSREVYGEASALPVGEDAPYRPLNVYARSKVAGEQLVKTAADDGLNAQICRFSNVYGCIDDHVDRVIPAFARAAAFGGEIRIDGAGNTFDFTHVRDVTTALVRLVDALERGERFPPIHFVSGQATSLGSVAEWVQRYARCRVSIREAPGRTFDVTNFCGDPARADSLLGWRAVTPPEVGFQDLIAAFRTAGPLHDPSRGPWLDRFSAVCEA